MEPLTSSKAGCLHFWPECCTAGFAALARKPQRAQHGPTLLQGAAPMKEIRVAQPEEDRKEAHIDAEPEQPCIVMAALSGSREVQAKQIFERFDSDGSGRVSVTEFAALLVKDKRVAAFMGLGSSCKAGRARTRSADSIFREMCSDGERELTWAAFERFITLRNANTANEEGREEQGCKEPMPAVLKLLPKESEEACQVFEMIDTDHSGSITCGELAAACVIHPKVAKFVAAASREASGRRRSADRLFNEMDTNGDREISLDEFLSFVAGSHNC
uniref:EF-hand domain-containing protein n=1 Tax=Pyrodinium bahamense TaxID=73915 RepID=A0A7S0FL52_9DINO